jgi:hypothetical protein
MKIVALICLASFMVTSLVVGLRVLASGVRTRKLPELFLATALLSVGFLAFAVGTAAKLLIQGTEETRSTLTALGLSIECLGVLALVAFSWRVFHPRARWAFAVAVTIGLAIATALTFEITSGQYLRYADSEPMSGLVIPLALAARGAGPAWMAFECFRYHAKLRKRARLGLAEPFVVHRVALWGTAIGASALAYLTSIVHRVIYGTGLREHDWALATVSLLAIVSAAGIAFAFFPPRIYRSWITK